MITRVRGRGQLEMRSFALTDMVRWGYSDLRNLGNTADEKVVRGVPALHRAARLRAEAVASLTLRCWRGEGQQKQRVDTTWQARLFRGRPNDVQTRFDFWETVEESLAWRNNAYVWMNVDPLTKRLTDWWALHPDQVDPDPKSMSYQVKIAAGYVDPVGRGNATYNVDETTILHIRGHGQGGQFVAPTPISVFKDALQSPVLRQRHEARMWRRGTAIQSAVVFPAGVSKDQADEWKENFKAAYEGTDSETTMVLGGGADVKPIGMTAVDSAYIDMAKLTVDDASRIMGVPANLLGAQLMRTVPNLEQDLATWLRFGLGPGLNRIETALADNPVLFPVQAPNEASCYPRFDTDEFVRGDLLTEATILVQLVQSGILLPDEARNIRGLDDLPNGQGKIPQITPVGGAPNPALKPAQVPVDSAPDATT